MPLSPPSPLPVAREIDKSVDRPEHLRQIKEKFGTATGWGYNRLAKAGYEPKDGIEHFGETRVSDSTTFWVNQLKAGNREAAQAIWQRYYRRLIGLARKRLSSRVARSVVDENDIVQSAFASFYRAAEQGRFPQLANSSDLWRLLIIITQRKISRRLRHQNCRKRRPDSNGPTNQAEVIDLDGIAGNEPTPQFCAAAIESFRELLDQLGDDTLRTLAVMKMESYTNEEIANHLKCSLSTVERKLRRIRHEWSCADQERGL